MATTHRHRGFTLIELMIAVSLAIVILLIVGQAFRTVVAVIAKANQLSTENNLLRAGYTLAMRDAAYWHSHANDQAPYVKGFTREGRPDSTSRRKRYFAPVEFAADPGHLDPALVANPNALLPHDRRSWARTHLANPARPVVLETDGSGAEKDRHDSSNLPQGFTPGHIGGDYSLVSASDMADAVRYPDLDGSSWPASWIGSSDEWRRYASARPRAMHQLFQRLGHLGVAEYMPRGNPLLYVDQEGRNPSHWSRPLYDPAPAMTDAAVWWNSFFSVDVLTDRGYHTRGQNSGAEWVYLSDLADLDASAGFHSLNYPSIRPDIRLMLIQPVTNGRSDQLLGTTVDDTITYRIYERIKSWKGGAKYDDKTTPDYSRHPDYLSTTVHLPANLSDQERDADRIAGELGIGIGQLSALATAAKPANAAVLKTQIFRSPLFAGGNLTVCRIVLQDPDSGMQREVTFTPLATTYRGARQHVAAVHRLGGGGPGGASPATGSSPGGDFYGY